MKLIDLENSYVFCNTESDNCWRTTIKSVLHNHTKIKKFLLTKECRAEKVGQFPFTRKAKSEFCVVVEEGKFTYFIRDNPILKGNDFNNHYYQINEIRRIEENNPRNYTIKSAPV